MTVHNKIDLTGQKLGRLTVLGEHGRTPTKQCTWLCRCDCGIIKVVRGQDLRTGHTSSCGCARVQHGESRSSEYQSWKCMISRCYNPKDPAFMRYGGRGIVVCPRWRRSVNAFVNDMGPRPLGFSLERINNDYHYCPANCKWASSAEQNRNRRSVKLCASVARLIRARVEIGEKHSDLARDYGISRQYVGDIVRRRVWKDV